jgi:hypothetical protein
VLRLRNNRLSGSLPETFWTMPNMFTVDLTNNM